MQTYIVTIDYEKEDGYWKIGHQETITLPGDKKYNDTFKQRAVKLVQARFPGCRVKRVDFV